MSGGLKDRDGGPEDSSGERDVRAQATDGEGQNTSGNDDALRMVQHSGA